MGEYVIKLPDVGEGVAEAELVEWNVKIGDLVREDTVLAAVMTDKATVEIPSPVDGEIIWLGGEIGQVLAIGSPLVRLKIEGEGHAVEPEPAKPAKAEAPEPPVKKNEATKPQEEKPKPKPIAATETPLVAPRLFGGNAPRGEGEKPLASPAVRLRAREAGVDLRQVSGTGPAGRITHEDLEAFFARGSQKPGVAALAPDSSVKEIKVVGLRRKIAEKMAIAKSHIPHITYVEEIDVTSLEELRAMLNSKKRADQPKLTILPFLMRAMVKAIADQPQLNALYDDEANIIHQHGGVHIGIAAQTPNGLVVPVVKHAEARTLWDCAAEVNLLADAAKTGSATREQLSGSTITITSLGSMGGVVTTPVINYPEVAIIGVNKISVRPVWDGTNFIPRKMMNLSSSFDHRVIDGWDAAVFIQRIRTLLETPALIFVEG
ncbi:dihydrolipoamide acetyltransferase family protein [Phyllobacterium zundukense]|uniref:Dihydrolipoamide acetyltransferase component of pyruvate dehydrogenase complex n=1 Tax=Phyllobacterium zundukense TaxID=1867719 RepID=A0A2N9W1Q8_9HYPH|nr:dihydrolipoamide acetyltransferase family protein [Phyllobacterium zundukense]ATU91551.1 branched-chain alpha-keto acid dehydrogenase subunit E2 [Phyllobacterium zundukense]PIO45676.1 branched-chain alpha-keto acid dehydrogenase subunit E2 [Phyllobacterium zundukense]